MSPLSSSLVSALAFLGLSLVPAPCGSSGFCLIGSAGFRSSALALSLLRSRGWLRLGFGFVPSPVALSVRGLRVAGVPACGVVVLRGL